MFKFWEIKGKTNNGGLTLRTNPSWLMWRGRGGGGRKDGKTEMWRKHEERTGRKERKEGDEEKNRTRGSVAKRRGGRQSEDGKEDRNRGSMRKRRGSKEGRKEEM